MRFNSLDQWLSWLESLHPKSIELGLDRLRQVMARLPDLLQLQQSQSKQLERRPVKVAAVAGTNGKGSCVASLEALCLAQGQTVGAYTSPHFLRYNERIRVNGNPASDQQIMAAFEAIDQARGDISLTYFEFGTLAALLIFVQEKVENLVLEVGLGGRLDAVNVIDSDVAVITSIALDHQDWLGNNRESIGREKAGILRSQRPAICVDQDPPQSLLNIAAEQQVKLQLAGRDLSWSRAAGGWSWCGVDRDGKPMRLSDLPMPQLPLPSVVAAMQAFTLLGNSLSEGRVAQALSNCELPGRYQRLPYRGRELILDVAHNPAAAEYLAERLRSSAGPTLAVFGVMADKDYPAMLEVLKPVVDHWYLCGLDNPRAAQVADLLSCAQGLGLSAEGCDTVQAGLNAALDEAQEGDQILVAGSFFTVAEALALVQASGNESVKPGYING